MASSIAAVLLRTLEERASAFLRALESIPDVQLFVPPVPGGNSPGNLALHAAGNLQKVVGLLAGDVPYERDRPYEFAARDVPRAELVARVNDAVDVARRVLASMTDERFREPAPNPVWKGESRGEHAARSVEHFGYHTGQIVLLAKIYARP